MSNARQTFFGRKMHSPRQNECPYADTGIIGMGLAYFASKTLYFRDGKFMNEFLLLTLIIVYVVISYVPISDAHKGNWQSHRNQQSSSGDAEKDASTRS